MNKLRVAFLCLAAACGSTVSDPIDAPGGGDPDGDTPDPADADSPNPPDATVNPPDASPPDADPPDASPPDAMLAFCGDGIVNAPDEDCDLGAANDDHRRCGDNCRWGAGLDGTVTGMMWETLTGGPNGYALQELHYAGQPLIHDTYAHQAYNIGTNAWVAFPASPAGSQIWSNAAVGATSMYLTRGGSMHRYDFATMTWTTVATGIPDGGSHLSAHTFDGDGFIWYHGPGNDLVRFNPVDNTFMTFTHPAHENFETRVVYDPETNMILSAGFLATSFVRFDLDTMTFLTPSAVSPGGVIRDHTCGDRSGNVYTGADDASALWIYTPATDTWTLFPVMTPMPHDNNATCVVSQEGYYYFMTNAQLFRISLGVYP